jgi:hypothetical protein
MSTDTNDQVIKYGSVPIIEPRMKNPNIPFDHRLCNDINIGAGNCPRYSLRKS